MKLLQKFTLKGAVLSSVLAFAIIFGLWNCNTEDIDENFPFITVNPKSIQFTTNGGEYDLLIDTNRPWAITGQEEWCSPSKTSGEGPATVTITCASNADVVRKATLRIVTTSVTADVLVTQDGIILQEIWYENCGTTESNPAAPWPTVAAYDGWLKGGSGAANVEYAADGAVSVRSNSPSSGYAGVSAGCNVMMAAGGASFLANKIALDGATALTLSFGTNETSDVLKVYYSVDGTNWTNVPFTKTITNWDLVKNLAFEVPAGTTELYLKFTAGTTTYGTRVDDMKLVTGGAGGPAINLSAYTWNPTATATSTTVNITSNTSWVITPDASASWCTLSGSLSGTDNGSFTVNVADNPGNARAATITVKSTDNTITRSFVVTQAKDEGTQIWYETCGTTASTVTGNWPLVAEYDGWLKGGTGAANVEYASDGGAVSVRSNSISSGYEGVSGGSNVMMAAAGASFLVKKIALDGATVLTLSFGTNEASGTLSLYYSTDGTTWTSLPFEKTTHTWGLVDNIVFVVPGGTTELYLKFTAIATTYGTRVDDMKLVAGGTVSDYLNVSPSDLTFNSAGESKSFAVSANVNWTVSSSDTWCAVSPASGSNNGAVTVTATANTATASRSATVTVSGTGVAAKIVTVNQEGAETPTDLNTPVVWDLTTFASSYTTTSLQSVDGSTSRLTVTANSGLYTANPSTGGYLITSPWVLNDAWVMAIPITSFTGGDLQVSYISQSSGTGPRDWAIEWSTDNSTWNSANSYSLVATTPCSGNSANAASMNISETLTVSGVTSKLYIRVRVATNLSVRAGLTCGTVTWSATEAFASGGTNRFTGQVKVEKYTTPTPALSVTPSTLSFVAGGENKTFNITSTATTWTVSPSDGWCTASASTGTGNSAVTVTATANTATTPRSATITVSGTGGVSNQLVEVTQAGATTPTGTVIWATNVGSVNVSGNTNIASFSGWETTGAGATNVEYSIGSGIVEVRTSGASAGYTGVSGGNNVFFGGFSGATSTDFVVSNINVAGLSATTLTFGSTNNSATYNPAHLVLYYSYDGYTWTGLAYTRTPALSGNWGLCEATITSIPSNSYLYFKWSATTASVCRVDDMSLTAAGSPSPAVKPVVTTGTAGSFTSNSANVANNSYIAGTSAITEVGVEYKIGAGAYSAQTTTIATPFTTDLTGLSPATTYTYRAYAKIAGGTAYGREKTFYTESTTPTLSVSPSTLSFVAGGENKTFNITSTATTWTVSPSEGWCTASASTGTGNSAVTVTATANTATTPRSATITVSGTGGVSNQFVEMTQAGATAATTFSAIWNFNGISGTATTDWPTHQAPQPPSSNTAAAIVVTDLTNTGFTSSNNPAAGTWGGTSFTATDRMNPVPNKYATTTLTSSSKVISIKKISGNIRRSGTGASFVSIQYQIGAGAFVEAWTNPTEFSVTTAAGNSFNVDLSGLADLQNIPIGTVVTIKIVPYKGPETAAGNWYLNSNTAAMVALSIEGTEL